MQRGDALHDAADAAPRFSVVRVAVRQERAPPPESLGRGWGGPAQEAAAIGGYYQARGPRAPRIRLRKQGRHGTRPALQDAAAGDRWSWRVSVAQWELYGARPLVADRPWPGQRRPPAGPVTPARVQAGRGVLVARMGSPARGAATAGNAPDYPSGRARRLRPWQPVGKKEPARRSRGRRRRRASPHAA